MPKRVIGTNNYDMWVRGRQTPHTNAYMLLTKNGNLIYIIER